MLNIPQESTKWTQLDSGLKVITVEMPSFYTVSAGLFAKAGSRCESENEVGLSHFIEHLLFKGSFHYNSLQMSEIIEGRGGSFNAYTSEEGTCFYLKTFPQYFEESMDVLLDMYTMPLFDPVELEKEREVIIEEIHSYEDQPSSYVSDIFATVIWKGQPLGNLIAGTEEQVSKYTREDLIGFFEKYYTTPNTVLAVAGHITHEEVLEWIKKHESRFRKGVPIIFPPYKEEPRSQQVKIISKKTEQCHIQFGVPCCDRYSEEQWALRIMSTVVGENMSSRLFQEIREKQGLAYHIGSGYDLYEDTGSFFVQSSMDSDKVEKCLSASLSVLGRLRDELISPDDLARAKSFVIGQVLQDMENTMSCMLWVGDKLLGNERNFSTAQFCQKIESVEAEDVRRLAQKLFVSSNLNLAMIGSYHQSPKLAKVLTF